MLDIEGLPGRFQVILTLRPRQWYDELMYLRGNKWSMTRRPKKRSNPWRIILLVILIGIALYFNQVVVPATPPLFIDTPTPTRSPESYVNEADQFYKEGKLTSAIDAYNQAIVTDPNNPAYYISLARIQVFAAKYDDAVVNAQNALLKNPNNAMAYAVEGWALSFTGDYLAAEAAVKKALELDPNSALAHAYYAEILIDRGDFGDVEKASSEAKLARELDPGLLEAHRAMALVYLNTQNIEEAVSELKAAISINDKIAGLHFSLGYAYKLLQENDQAVEELGRAYALNPDDPEIPTEISSTYANVGQFGKAAQYAEDATKIDPTNPKWHGNLGVMYYKNQEFDKSINELALAVHGGTTADGQAVKGMPLDYGLVAQYYAVYGLALAKNDQCGEAIPVFRALLSGVPDDETSVYNANFGLNLCLASVTTPSPEVTTTPTP
jgi:tetratricopeptide (TPR) repeat protein